MAEAVVSMVAERLGNLLIEEAKLIHGVGDQVRDIRDELWWMQCFLKDADARQRKDHRVRTWVREIKEIAYDAGDVLESFILKVESKKGGGILNVLKRYVCIVNEGIVRHKVGSEIQAIETRISKLTTHLQTYGIRSLSEDHEGSSFANQRDSQLRQSYSHVGQDDFVGLQDDVKLLVECLVKDDSNQVVSICGMGGLGKTTLARKVYNHEEVKRHFDAFAWVCISQTLQLRYVLQQIFTKLEIPTEEGIKISKLGNDQLMEKIFNVQKEKKCLIVLDDIWDDKTWDCLKDAFPSENMKGKLLLTSRNKEVAVHVNPRCFRHEPQKLKEDDCWDLLKKKAFTNVADADSKDLKEKEILGRAMIEECEHLPLAIVVLGGILATNTRLEEWEMVHENIKLYLTSGEGIGQHGKGVLIEMLASSYDDLPYQLKPCFLYLGKFAEDSEIEVERLYHLWMAESMVLSEDRKGGETLMDVAERYLGELAKRCMVQVQLEENVYGLRKFKSCRLHDVMRVFCLSKAEEEEFFNVIAFQPKNDDECVESLSSSTNRSRRIVIFSDGQNTNGRDISLVMETGTQHLRSMLFFNGGSYRGGLHSLVRSLINEFRLLRVLAIEGLILDSDVELNIIKMSKMLHHVLGLAKAVGNLIHLRYLSLRDTAFLMVPSFLSNLKHLQTLDLRGMYLLYLPCMRDALRKMERLRHLYLPEWTEMEVRVTKLRLDGFSNLETLENFDPSWCESTDLSKLINLRKLTIVVKPYDLVGLEGVTRYLMSATFTAKHTRYFSLSIPDGCDFVPEKWQKILIDLLGCGCLHELEINCSVGGKLPAFNQVSKFSSSLTVLTLFDSRLDEDPMPTLGNLPNLRSLILWHAFLGEAMVCSKNYFLQLRSLQLLDLEYLEDWRVEEGAMPKLTQLRFHNLRFRKLPDGLRFISTLRELRISDMDGEFTEMVQEVKDGEKGEDFEIIGHVASIIIE